MSKIPKRDGQKLNGIAPSVFALAFLLVGIPLFSTYLISSAMYFGDDPVVESYTKSDILLGEYPFYSKSGDGPDAKCDAAWQSMTSANCSASLSAWPYSSLMAFNDTWHQRLQGCASGSGYISNLNSLDCGDSGYVIHQNITSRLADSDRTFPIVSYNFTGTTLEECDWNSASPIHGDSKVDYTITVEHIKRQPIWAGTNIWTYAYSAEEIEMSGTSNFNNSFVDVLGYSYPEDEINYRGCRAKVNVVHDLDFIDLDNMNRMIEDYRENSSESFGIFISIELDNLRTEGGYSWSSRNFHNPFTGNNDTTVKMYLDLVTYELDPMNTFIRFGVAGMGIGFWLIAIASTPYWDPFISKMQGVRKQ